MDKQKRTGIFLARLEHAPPCATHDDALDTLATLLNATEDEFTDIPYAPERWESDGRLYPPQSDMRRDTTHPGVACYRHRKHRTFIGANGAIKITLGADTWLDKAGADGMTVTQLMATKASTPS